jgi:hypothetical protein
MAQAALDAGWRVLPGMAEGPPRSIGLRLSRLGYAPLFAWWVEKDGKWQFQSGLARDITRGICKTQKRFIEWLTLDPEGDNSQ